METNLITIKEQVKIIEERKKLCQKESGELKAALDKLATEHPQAYAEILRSNGELNVVYFDTDGKISGFRENGIVTGGWYKEDKNLSGLNEEKSRALEKACLSR